MTIELKFGGYQGDKSVHTRGGRFLAEAVAEETDGRVKINFDENIVVRGHKAAELLSMTESGELDGCYFSCLLYASPSPRDA